MKLSSQEFELLRKYIHDICGLAISDNKAYLIRQRLEPLAMAHGCNTFSEFYQLISRSSLPMLQEKIINAITTNETSFFRDGHPFAAFEEHILPKLGKMICDRKARPTPRKGPKVRLWSAGSSSGQESYSLAMLIQEYAAANRHLSISEEDFGILATDISSKVLSRAMTGEYSEAEIKRGLSPDRSAKYFKKAGQRWTINSSIRSMVEFRQINLVRPFGMLGGFDVIFCRNVLIYFDNSTKTRVIDQFFNMLSQEGILILGATENVYGISDRFDSVHHGPTLLYRKCV
ncbi:protein-glutamate O-methyltransferase CheR [Desulfobacterales bacterium HSG2]|nr:protein-glutamate O-methyltransferase CheR [Desulfobacterales bacterium HSG2]